MCLFVFPLEVESIACFPRRSILSEVDKQKSVVVLMVSPLISLMKDQVRAMIKKNMTAVFGSDEDAHSEICHSKYQLVFDRCICGIANDMYF